MISHSVEISMAGGVRKMVRGPTARRFFFFFFYFLSGALISYLTGVQRRRGALAIVKKNPHPLSTLALGKKPSTQVPLVWNQPHPSHIQQEILL